MVKCISPRLRHKRIKRDDNKAALPESAVRDESARDQVDEKPPSDTQNQQSDTPSELEAVVANPSEKKEEDPAGIYQLAAGPDSPAQVTNIEASVTTAMADASLSGEFRQLVAVSVVDSTCPRTPGYWSTPPPSPLPPLRFDGQIEQVRDSDDILLSIPPLCSS